MVGGIESFKAAFKGYTDCFMIIGGSACDIIMDQFGLDFRATKDLDIVLIVEAVKKEFYQVFWEYVKEAGYENREKSAGEKQFYRFSKPKDRSYPFMLELFSRKLEGVSLPDEAILTPVSTSDAISSLSAIILDDDYYQFIQDNKIILDDLPYVSENCLIPLKAKAWIDLTERKEAGDRVDSRDIKKHKNDIIRLCQLLPTGVAIELPQGVKADMLKFIELYEKEAINPKSMQVRLTPEKVYEILREYYKLDK